MEIIQVMYALTKLHLHSIPAVSSIRRKHSLQVRGKSCFDACESETEGSSCNSRITSNEMEEFVYD